MEDIDERMRKHEGDDYPESDDSPPEDAGVFERMLTRVAVAFVLFVALAVGVAMNAEGYDDDDRERVADALRLLCSLTPHGRVMAIIDLNKSLDDMDIAFGVGCKDDPFGIDIDEGEFMGKPAHRLQMDVFYVRGKGEGSI